MSSCTSIIHTLWKRELARYSGSCTSRLASSSWSNTAGPTKRKSPSLQQDWGEARRGAGQNTAGPTNKQSPSLQQDWGEAECRAVSRAVSRAVRRHPTCTHSNTCCSFSTQAMCGSRRSNPSIVPQHRAVAPAPCNPPVLHAILDKALAAGQQLHALLRLAVALRRGGGA